MANKTLFAPASSRLPAADAVNAAGGAAYRSDPRHALALYAATGCLNGTFYASAGRHLDTALKLCDQVEPEFIARTALYARREAHMKDLPALLLAVLATRSPGLLAEAFDRVIDSPKMLRTFVQIVRSGVTGRRSLGSLPKRCVREWLAARTDLQLFTGSIGRDPSLADVVKMVHPKPANPERSATLAYLLGKSHDAALLPEPVRAFEAFKAATPAERESMGVPDVPFQVLTSLDLGTREWIAIARHAPWTTTRMNLNTFLRHGVFHDRRNARLIADRLRDPELIARSRCFPYQLLAAYTHASDDLPGEIREALQDAMELALRNVPVIRGRVHVLVDVSGSMSCPVTGHRSGSTTKMRCVDVAGLFAAAILRKNPDATVMPFESKVVEKLRLNPRDTVMTNATKLASVCGGGTNCSAPLAELNRKKAAGDTVIYLSDNESWIDTRRKRWGNIPTETLKQWELYRKRNPNARLVCIDLVPGTTVQAPERPNVTNVGGFSDQVFKLVAAVAAGRGEANFWVSEIEKETI